MEAGNNYGRDIFAKDSERYNTHLFGFTPITNGHRFPDLLAPLSYPTPLAFEIKTGSRRSAVLCEHQLHYGTIETIPMRLRHVLKEAPHVYYNPLKRMNNLDPAHAQHPYGGISLQWGDQYMVPAELAFVTFVISKALRTKQEVTDVRTDLEELRRKQTYGEITGKEKYTTHSQAWQSIRTGDLDALFTEDYTRLKAPAKKRIDLLRTHYPAIDDLIRISINGPNKTHIFVFSEPCDAQTFAGNLTEYVETRTATFETITRLRHEALPLLAKQPAKQVQLFGDSDHASDILSPDERNYLHALSTWRMPR